jgi:hypothetical protein
MGKIYLKRIKAPIPEDCEGCYFYEDDKNCVGLQSVRCFSDKIYKKISESTAKKLLKSGWRRSDAML